MKLLLCIFLRYVVMSSLLGPRYLPYCPVFKYLQPLFLLNVRDRFSLPCKQKAELTDILYSVFCWPCITVYQYSETNVMHLLLNLLRIKGLYMFWALLAHPQEALHERNLVYCMRVMSVGCTRVGVEILVQPTDITHMQNTKCYLWSTSRGWASSAQNIYRPLILDKLNKKCITLVSLSNDIVLTWLIVFVILFCICFRTGNLLLLWMLTNSNLLQGFSV
jgi:hypothetical protein